VPEVAHLVCEDGISGDLLVGALLDAGAPLGPIREAVTALGIGGVRISAEPDRSTGLAATRFRVRTRAAPRFPTSDAVRTVIRRAGLPPTVRTRADAVLARLVDAEAAVHGVDPSEVRLHELGDPDTLVDIVAACTAIDTLGLTAVTCGPVALGGGTVRSDHGRLPVPAPAVAALLEGFEVHGGGRRRELATPTGAALVAVLSRPVPEVPPLRLTGSGRGIVGAPDQSSSLTVLVGERPARQREHPSADGPAPAATTAACVVEATVDDLSPELVPIVLDAIRDAGADDAWAVPALMKKGRPGFTLTALVSPELAGPVRDVVFTQSTTIGLRTSTVVKEALARRSAVIDVLGHQVRVKIAEHGGRVVSAKPEIEDVRAVAAATGQPVPDVHASAQRAAASLGGPA
jgi:pyridinium-3,5-bisthiocarboxylic acid mononucleotide nickel chelatase